MNLEVIACCVRSAVPSALLLLIFLTASHVFAADLTPVLPKGDSIRRIKGWTFFCQQPGEYTIAITLESGEDLLGVPFKSQPNNGVCMWAGHYLNSARLTRGYLDLARQYSWRAVSSTGVKGPKAEFRIHRIADITFSAEQSNYSFSDNSWVLNNGWAENKLNNANASVFTRVQVGGLPGGARDVENALHDGLDVEYRVESSCPELTCEVSFQFALSPRRCAPGGGSCWHDYVMQFVLPADDFPYVEKLTWVGTRYESYKVAQLTEVFLDLSRPRLLRFTRNGIYLRVSVDNKAVACIRDPTIESGHPYSQVGLNWRTWEDDEGKNIIRVDKIRYAASPKITSCRVPLPLL